MDGPNRSDFSQIFQFILELEKLKNITRKTKTLSADRYENSAEHSWQIALLALSLAPYSQKSVDVQHVIKLLLLHDVVEIDAGDKFLYSAEHDDYENELRAAKRIFGLLPSALADEYLQLWLEMAAKETAEARFASAIDRLMPVLQNLYNQGQSWVENQVRLEQVLQRNAIIADIHPELWQMVKEQLELAAAQGYLK